MPSLKHRLSTRRCLALAIMSLALATSGCGTTEETKTATGPEPASSPPSNQGAEAQQASRAAATGNGDKRKPQKGKNETEKTEDVGSVGDTAYRESKELCSLFPVHQIAAEYGGDPANPASVARAYAETSYRPEFQASAEVGCLEGLR